MRVLAVIINIFIPGLGTFLVGKWVQAIFQLLLGALAGTLIITGAGVIIGSPLGFIVWVWAIVSAAVPKERVVVVQPVDKSGS